VSPSTQTTDGSASAFVIGSIIAVIIGVLVFMLWRGGLRKH
jgi:hypothetical protein